MEVIKSFPDLSTPIWSKDNFTGCGIFILFCSYCFLSLFWTLFGWIRLQRKCVIHSVYFKKLLLFEKRIYISGLVFWKPLYCVRQNHYQPCRSKSCCPLEFLYFWNLCKWGWPSSSYKLNIKTRNPLLEKKFNK